MRWAINQIICIFVDFFVMQYGKDIQFRIRRTSRLEKLMKDYCNRKSLEPLSINFRFKWRYISPHDTPEKVLLKNKIYFIFCLFFCMLKFLFLNMLICIYCCSLKWKMGMLSMYFPANIEGEGRERLIW